MDHLLDERQAEDIEAASDGGISMNQDDNGKQDACQLQGIIRCSPPAGKEERAGLSFLVRIKRALRRKLSVPAQKKIKSIIGSVFELIDQMRGKGKPSRVLPDPMPSKSLNAGDLVRVRPREEIQATLDRWRSFKGCAFLEEMAPYCGTTQRVLKRVERFMDERDYRMKKAAGIVLLEGVICPGTGTTGRCDRSCFFFWRQEWLEKLNGTSLPTD